MGDLPSLFSLSMKAVSEAILHGGHHLEDIFELPSDLLDCLLMQLPPLALQNLHQAVSFEDPHSGFASSSITEGRKRGRYGDFNRAWKTLFNSRWRDHVKQIQQLNYLAERGSSEECETSNYSVDWQQLYWETHLQNCLDEASETALRPGFDGCIGEIIISDTIMKCIGCSARMVCRTCDCNKTSYHCLKFGCYARSLRLSNVLCVTETCELLRGSSLQGVVFYRIKTKVHVDGVCKLLSQNKDTLLSLAFIHCRLPRLALNEICNSVCNVGTQIHRIQHFSVTSSSIFESKPTATISELLSFLSSGRSLSSLNFCDTHMGPKVAKMIFDALLDSSSGLFHLDLSENNIAGWLSKVKKRFGSVSPSSLGSDLSLKLLRDLNLRGNNLCIDDAEDLKQALVHMPNLRSLDISDNPIMDYGLRSLIPYFIGAFEKSSPLYDLKVENCSLSSIGMTQLLTSLLTVKEPVKALSIAGNDLGSCIAVSLVKFLGTSRVKKLNIEDIGLGPLGFQVLEEEMPREVDLVYINISKNRGGIRAASFVSKVILQAPELVQVNAGYNFMPPEALEIIYDALKQFKGKLEQLDLTGNTKLSHPTRISMLQSFHFHGKPIVTLPSPPSSTPFHDDDP